MSSFVTRRSSKKILLGVVVCATFSLLPAKKGYAIDWITAPSTYTHNKATGQRVTQYEPIGPFAIHRRDNYLQSGYRHLRSSIQLPDGGYDHFHVLEEWGRPVRPYGEWRFPYRPYAVPYDQWGPPFGGLGRPQHSPYYGYPWGNIPGRGPIWP
ncbi:MAG: hypothetical protein MPJ24_10125 [Pirellulaceae bacterium]|nr:hypothetical protein [Pirellulaceae bacterium]